MPHAVAVAMVVVAGAAATAVAWALPLPTGPNDFNSPGFLVRHSWQKFAMLATRPLRGDLSRAEEDAKVARFFELNRLIAEQERIAGDPTTPPAAASAATAEDGRLRAERAGLTNAVALILEGRLTRVIKQAGLTRQLGADVVWPPVDIEFADPPSVLVKSPRNEIRTESQTLLQGDLAIGQVEQIEAKAQRDGKTSALVVQIGGIAMYPAIIPPDEDYRSVLEDIAHEWTHQYLFFTPLGRRYFESGKLTTLNETVANMVGQELGDMMTREYPLEVLPTPTPQPTPAAGSGSFDFTATMRGLQTQVVTLLKAGQVDEAERLMERTREELAAQGYYIRKINQAYFAFYGSYADTAGSIDPIGPKLAQLRQESPTLEAFMRTAQGLTSEADLDRALATR